MLYASDTNITNGMDGFGRDLLQAYYGCVGGQGGWRYIQLNQKKNLISDGLNFAVLNNQVRSSGLKY